MTLFGGPAFIQPIRAFQKLSKRSDWLEKRQPFKKATLILDMRL